MQQTNSTSPITQGGKLVFPSQSEYCSMSRGALTPMKRLKTDYHPEFMDLEHFSLLRNRQRSSIQTARGSHKWRGSTAPRQSFDLATLRSRFESDLQEVHRNHLLLKRLGEEKSNLVSKVFKCVDMIDCQIMALKFTTLMVSSTPL